MAFVSKAQVTIQLWRECQHTVISDMVDVRAEQRDHKYGKHCTDAGVRIVAPAKFRVGHRYIVDENSRVARELLR
jgi:hypothetical protein